MNREAFDTFCITSILLLGALGVTIGAMNMVENRATNKMIQGLKVKSSQLAELLLTEAGGN